MARREAWGCRRKRRCGRDGKGTAPVSATRRGVTAAGGGVGAGYSVWACATVAPIWDVSQAGVCTEATKSARRGFVKRKEWMQTGPNRGPGRSGVCDAQATHHGALLKTALVLACAGCWVLAILHGWLLAMWATRRPHL